MTHLKTHITLKLKLENKRKLYTVCIKHQICNMIEHVAQRPVALDKMNRSLKNRVSSFD